MRITIILFIAAILLDSCTKNKTVSKSRNTPNHSNKEYLDNLEEHIAAHPYYKICHEFFKKEWKQLISFDHNQISLGKSLLSLTKLTNIKFQIDKKSFDELGLTTEELVNIKVTKIPFDYALFLLLDQFGLTPQLKDGTVLLIKTKI